MQRRGFVKAGENTLTHYLPIPDGETPESTFEYIRKFVGGNFTKHEVGNDYLEVEDMTLVLPSINSDEKFRQEPNLKWEQEFGKKDNIKPYLLGFAEDIFICNGIQWRVQYSSEFLYSFRYKTKILAGNSFRKHWENTSGERFFNSASRNSLEILIERRLKIK